MGSKPWIFVAKVRVKEVVLRPWILVERVSPTDNRPERSEISISIKWTVLLAWGVTLLGNESVWSFGPHDSLF